MRFTGPTSSRLAAACAAVVFVAAEATSSAFGAYYTGNEGMRVLWHFDAASAGIADNAAPPSAAPTDPPSTANYDGVLNGSVTAGAQGAVNAGYEGFNSTGSYVEANNLVNWSRKPYTFEAWVRGPQLSFSPNHWYDPSAAVIARGGAPDANKSSAWQLAVESDGSIRISGDTWNGHEASQSSAALTWDPNTWYHVALTWDPKWEEIDEQWDWRYYVDVYRTAAGSDQVQSVISGMLLNTDPAGGGSDREHFTVGAAPYAYYHSMQGGYFGGQIDEVVLWDGVRSEAQLDQTLQMVPEPGTLALLGLGGLTLLTRKRRIR